MVDPVTVVAAAAGIYLGIDFARALVVANIAYDRAFEHFPEDRKDKWRHGYVGCELGKALVTPITAEAFAYGYEIVVSAISDAPISVADAEAVMCGFWNAQNGTHWGWVPTKIGACTINVLQLITVPCVTICWSLEERWDYFDSIDGADDSSDNIGDGYSTRVLQDNFEVINKMQRMVINDSNQLDITNVGVTQVKQQLTDADKKSLEKIAIANEKITREKIQEIKSESGGRVLTVKYLLNTNKKEIHDLSNLTHLCNVTKIASDHRKYLNHIRRASGMMALGYDGCKHCLPKLHTK